MSLPGDLGTVILTGKFLDPAGNPMRGTVTITPNATLTDATGNVIIPQLQRAYQLFNGTFTTSPLVGTDNSDINPSGWTYLIQIALQEVPAYSFNVALPSSGSPVDLSTLSPAQSIPELAGSLPVTGGTLTGKLTLTGSTPLQIPAGAAAGDVLTSDASGNASWSSVSADGIATTSALAAETTRAEAAEATLTASIPALPVSIAHGGTGAITGTAALTALGADSRYGQLATASIYTADQYFKSGRPWFDAVAFGADPSGVADSTSAINSAVTAAVSGGVVYLPEGTFTISGSGIIAKGTDVEIRGCGNTTVIRPSASVSALIQSSSSAPGARFRLTNLCLDGLFEATNVIAYTGSQLQGLELDHVTLRNPGTIGLNLSDSSGVKAAYCTFTGNSQTGRPNGTMVSIGNGCRRLRFSYCDFESYVNGIIGGSSTTDPYGLMIDDVETDHCYFNGSWWLIPPATSGQAGTPSNSGSTVTYTSTVLTDTGAAFSGMTTGPSVVNNNIRVMPVRTTGTVTTVRQTALVDSAAAFTSASSYGVVSRGDVVRTSAAWAMVEEVSADGITLRVSPWRSLTTWQATAPPAVSTAYTVYATIIGRVTAFTSTTLTTNEWHDYFGNQVTPPAHTLYEILTQRPNYAFNFNLGSWNVRTTNCEFFANWSDQCSNFGNESQVIGNYIHDGQDGGITIFTGDRHIVSGNRIRHQGSACMFFYGSNSQVTGNAFQGGTWVNQITASDLGEVQATCQNTAFTGNSFITDTGISGIASQAYGLSLTSGTSTSNGQCYGNYVAADNVFGGHTVADIWLDGAAGSSHNLGVNEIHAQAGTVIAYNGGTAAQMLSYSGTGAPSLLALPGSAYAQTDAAISPAWTYGPAGWSQGIANGILPGSLAVGGAFSAYGGVSSASLSTPAGLAVTPTGTTGSTTYGYRIAAVAGNSVTTPCAEVQTTTGNATLSGTNYNAVSWTAVTGALAYNVYGRTHNAESLLAQVLANSYNDTGAAAPAAARNLLNATVVTPSFTGGTTTGWSLKTGATIAADTTTGPNVNGCSLEVVTSGSAGSGCQSSPASGPAATGGQPYTLSFYIKGSGTGIAFLNSDPAFTAFASNSSIALTSTWTRYSITGTAPGGASTLYAQFECNTATTFWISAIQIDAGSTASAYIDTTAAIAMPATGSQFTASAWPSQTSPPLLVQNSSASTVFSVDPSGNTAAASMALTGLTGATAASRYAGATASGAPVTGTFALGDFVIDQTGEVWICTTGGTIGSGCVFTEASGGLTNPMSATGDMIVGGTSGAAARLAGNTSATKNFLTSTGTGSAANTQAWGTIAAADMPAISVQWVTSSGSFTWTKPAAAQTVDVILCGGGGGGGSGAIETSGNAGGGGGGAGGGVLFRTFSAGDLPSSVTGSVGAGGTSGGAVSGTGGTSGNPGGTGGITTFGAYAAAGPGNGGAAGTASGGSGGSSSQSVGTNIGGAGGAGGTGVAGVGSLPAAGPAGGGGGGGATSSTAFSGAAGSYSMMGSTSNTGTAGVAGGASPGTGTQPSVKGTASGGGGGGAGIISASGTAQTGATPFYGGGGGGGGAAFISGTSTSGAGGVGGSGFALIITHFA